MTAPMRKLRIAGMRGQELRPGEFQRDKVPVMRHRWRQFQPLDRQ